VENSELASPDAAPSALDGAAVPDAGLAGADVPVASPDAMSPDVPLATPDAPATVEVSAGRSDVGGNRDSMPVNPATCTDNDGDGYGVGAGCLGPDCDDNAPFCTSSCVDADKNGVSDCAEYWFGETKVFNGWTNTFTGEPNLHFLGASTLFKTSDGNFLIPTRTDEGFGAGDIQLIKITPQGKVVWKKIYGTTDDEQLTGAVQATDGSLLLLAAAGRNSLPLIVKVDENGSILASKTVPKANPGEYMAYGASLLPSGDFLVTGLVGTQSDSWVGQLAADVMSFAWETKYTGLSPGAVHTLLRLPDGDLFAVRDILVIGSLSTQILKLGPNGELRWARGGLPWYVRAATAPDGNVVLAWIGQSSPFTVLKLTPNGDGLWQRSTLGHGAAGMYNSSLAIQIDSFGNVFAAASNNMSGTASTPLSWLTKLSSIGDVLWTYSTGKYAPQMLFPDTDGSLLLVDATGIGRIGPDPSTSCILGPQTDTLKPSNVTFTAVTPVVSTMTPWVLADYPINTMSGTVTWKPICPAAAP
jgi:hypothetical protein